VRVLVEDACALGMHIAVVSGTHVGNVDGQLCARPDGPGSLHLLLNRGSEVYRVDREGVRLLERRSATAEEDAALSAAAEITVRRLGERDLAAKVVSERLNRRKVDLIPEPEWADPPKAQIDELLAAVEARLRAAGIESLRGAVEIAAGAAVEAGLSGACVTSDAKHVEIGLTDKSDSASWFFAELWRRGIGPGLVLVAGDEMGALGGVPGSDSRLLSPAAAERATAISVGVEPGGAPGGVRHVGGGPGSFTRLLAAQVERRRQRAVPELDEDPGWTIDVVGVDRTLERVHESLLTLADGRLGTAGTPLGRHPAAAPLVLAGGFYTGSGPGAELARCPVWNLLPFDVDEASVERTLDLHTGLLRCVLAPEPGPVETMLFSSLARPGTTSLRAAGPQELLGGGEALSSPTNREWRQGADGERVWMKASIGRGGVVVAASEYMHGQDGLATLERTCAYRESGVRQPQPEEALAGLGQAENAGYERLLSEHREAWAGRWEEADVRIDGDDELQVGIRFALFHLMASVGEGSEAAVGARGLSGAAYAGHVFWDACAFVLPFLAATHPESARAMLEYRIHRLPAARAAARAAGRRGARFPWESAASGDDVTPGSAFSRAGERLPVLTGELEEHIVADVAWGVGCYAGWSGDAEFLAGAGGGLVVDTARYWASRIERDARGRAHISDVMGPDEYHPHVDDNAFTNVMARWNLRFAAGLPQGVDGKVTDAERDEWLVIADSLVDGYDPASGVYEQFAGFDELEPLVIAELAPRRPIAADLLLGRARVESAQVIKQADVLMLHHLVPDEVEPGSLGANLDFYEPRTAHASSLSPGIHAALLARAGRYEAACEALSLTARIDLDDISETTAGGLHLAAMGSAWQALAFGFAGLRPTGDALRLDPRLPPQWRGLDLRLRFRGTKLRLEIGHDGVEVVPEAPLTVRLGDGEPVTVGPEGAMLGAGIKRNGVRT
jgi:Glycosyl hydrolase family 65 central catalytic domain/Glycosyl hydrolase family 65, C-terminal domain